MTDNNNQAAASPTGEGRANSVSPTENGAWTWETDRRHRFTGFSGELEAATEFSPELLVGTSRYELFRTAGNPHGLILDHLEDLDRHRPFRDFVYKVRLGAAERWVSVSGTPIFTSGGEFAGYRGIGRDVTALVKRLAAQDDGNPEAKRAAKALNAALSATDSGVLLFDTQNRLYAFNEAMKALCGDDGDILVHGASLGEVAQSLVTSPPWRLEPESRESFVTYMTRAADASKTATVTRLADGRLLQARGNRTSEGFLVVTFADVTEPKRRETDLENARSRALKAEQIVTNVLDALPLSIIVFDADDNFVLANQTLRGRATILDPVLQPGKTLRDVVEFAHAKGIWRDTGEPEIDALYDVDKEAWIEASVERHRRASSTRTRRTEDGRWIQVSDRRLADGTFIGLRTDITELKMRESTVEENFQLLDMAIRSMDAGLAIYGPDDRLLVVNPAMNRLYPEMAAALQPGTHFRDIIAAAWRLDHPDVAREDVAASSASIVEERLRASRQAQHEFMETTRSGRTMQVRYRRTETGHLLVTRSDITDIANKDRQLDAAREASQRSGEILTEVLNLLDSGVIVY
ncbi:MAG TPA: PAS-domain containing protein, partial [Rhizobiaceae bacterium]|nr:PAS-domain containing protein [Rhizobiaceae bacterium]